MLYRGASVSGGTRRPYRFRKSHNGILPLFCPTRQTEFAKYEIRARFELQFLATSARWPIDVVRRCFAKTSPAAVATFLAPLLLISRRCNSLTDWELCRPATAFLRCMGLFFAFCGSVSRRSSARRERRQRIAPSFLSLRPPGLQTQSATAIASISIIHSGAASAETPTRVEAGGSMPSKKTERALPMIGRSSGL